MTAYDRWLAEQQAMKHVEPEATMPEPLVHSSTKAHWLDPQTTGNPSRIGALPEVPEAIRHLESGRAQGKIAITV